jgi:hypothetical protein
VDTAAATAAGDGSAAAALLAESVISYSHAAAVLDKYGLNYQQQQQQPLEQLAAVDRFKELGREELRLQLQVGLSGGHAGRGRVVLPAQPELTQLSAPPGCLQSFHAYV